MARDELARLIDAHKLQYVTFPPKTPFVVTYEFDDDKQDDLLVGIIGRNHGVETYNTLGRVEFHETEDGVELRLISH